MADRPDPGFSDYAGCPVPSNATIWQQDLGRPLAAEAGSAALLKRILAYYRKHHPESGAANG